MSSFDKKPPNLSMNEIVKIPMIGTLEPIKEFELWKQRTCMQL